jgi:glycosyltransferase involved in cell wall biosynthesis
MKQIGYFNRTRYWQIYAFNNPPDGYQAKRAINIPFHLAGINNTFLRHTKFVAPFQNVDLYHSYNSVVTTRKPWVVEVESTVPRYGSIGEDDKRFNWAIDKLKSDACGAVIFTSECTRKLNRENFNRWCINPDKCHVVYRAVEPHEPLKRNGKEKDFTILFVGNGFYRKGGIELLKAFKQFDKRDARLVIVSSFEVDWEVYPTDEEMQFVHDEIKQNEQIELYQNLSHPEVINWMRKSDVFVNTSYADPFNNTILEALSCGVPVIVSDVRATPEFVEEAYNGFMVTPDIENRENMIDNILNGIEKYYYDSELLQKHRSNAKKMVESKFLLTHRNNSLKSIYDEVLSS